ncbi:hypothetical protein ACLIBH_07420 [Virgibacillus sp. W0430]|uniref:hypothetical protein n=1 Tax=Virgibacillus sp. W0430 TaxID=3391580 RepID=UPI003F445660
MSALPERARDYVTLLDGDLEFRMHKEQLQVITDLHNNGIHYEDIAQKIKREPIEVIIALLHQAYGNRVDLQPLAYNFNTKNAKE